MPAATAIGHPVRSGRFQLYWLSARDPGTPLAWDEVVVKFGRLTRGIVDASGASTIAGLVRDIDRRDGRALAGALRQYRGVNETISSLLLGYIAIAVFKHLVEGPLRDPASLNKPSTPPLAEALRIGPIMGEAAFDSWLGDVHWGLVIGAVLCLLAGADSIFYGDTLLTTGNPDVAADQELLAAAGVSAWEQPVPA